MEDGIRILRLFTAVFTLTMVFSSCAEESNSSDEDIVVVEEKSPLSEIDSKRAILVESIIRSSPTLAQTSDIFGTMGSEFNRSYLNELENVSKYATLKSQGINLGTYLADLGYITSFEQSQEVIFYMNCAQKMAEGIGVSDVFDEKTVERMEMNINDKDSLLAMISDLYWKTDAFLKELNRQNISALIICGAWVEAMQIGAMIIDETENNDPIFAEMLSQQRNLKKILNLLNTFENDENIDYFKGKFEDIDGIYASLPESDELIPEQKEGLKQVATKVIELRAEITAP